MNNIAAIETVYKNYRFRSRLEARWAMFFDMIGVTWTHEPQPFNVDGEAYLPDFLLSVNGKEVVHEVKSLHETKRIQPQHVYLAGKMKPEHEWRGEAAVTHRETRDGSFDETSSPNAWSDNARLVRMGITEFVHVGPFTLSCDHGCSHNPYIRHMAEGCSGEGGGRIGIAGLCLKAIGSASIVCAHINTADAFGTLVEIGLAKHLVERLYVTVAEDVAVQRPADMSHYDNVGPHDYWFACVMANQSAVVKDNAEARAFHAARIRENTAREYRLISSIGGDRDAALTFGDPLDVVNQRHAYQWGAADLVKLCIANRDAAQRIRAHRFDVR